MQPSETKENPTEGRMDQLAEVALRFRQLLDERPDAAQLYAVLSNTILDYATDRDGLRQLLRSIEALAHRTPNDDHGFAWADVPLMVERELSRLITKAREVESDLTFARLALDSMRRERDSAEAVAANWKARAEAAERLSEVPRG